jgi:hypothetical protein
MAETREQVTNPVTLRRRLRDLTERWERLQERMYHYPTSVTERKLAELAAERRSLMAALAVSGSST